MSDYLKKHVYKYGLIIKKEEKINLSSCYAQNTPNRSLENYYIDKVMYMKNSPHFELASIYFNMGMKTTIKLYKKTRYCAMMEKMHNTRKIPLKFFRLCDSISKKGYLSGHFKNNKIILLNVPFARSRYCRDVPKNIPEIWSGHHRAGALLALSVVREVTVLIAEDINNGNKKCFPKLDSVCL